MRIPRLSESDFVGPAAFVAGALMLAIFSCAIARGDVFYVSSAGIWKSETNAGTPLPWVQIQAFGQGDSVVFDRIASPDPDPPQPPDSNLTAKVKEITEKHISKKLEGQALLAIVKLLDRVEDGKLDLALTTSVNALASNSLFPGNKFKLWLSDIKSLAPITRSYLSSLIAGISSTFDLTASARLDDSTAGNLARSLIVQPGLFDNLDIEKLLELLKLIITILTSLGIL